MALPKTEQLGAALIKHGYLTQAKLTEALSEQKRTGRMLGRVLIENNFITEEQMARVVGEQSGLPFVDLRRFEVNPDVVRVLNEMQARRFKALVLEDRGDSYLVGFSDPSNLRAQDELAALIRRPIDAAVITNEQFTKTADRIYRKTDQLEETANEAKLELERESGVIDLNQLQFSIDNVDAPVVKFLQTVFEEAVQMRASDIHIEPEEGRLCVRFRIDGQLHEQVQTDLRIAPALLVRLKLMASLDIAEKRLPQDGGISIRVSSQRIDVRLSTIPTLYGEAAVMRLLLQSQGLRTLDASGMPPAVQEKLLKMAHRPHGIVLVTGPTGSGKTTTLYGVLQQLNQRNVKILTVEDPVEYRISGINQVQVNDKIQLTFARMLRSFLRQDPDILLVGEVRDSETAEIAARAAMTGHLVLSTLHTNDAASTPGRLLDMGIPGFLIASTLLGVMSQRLLRVICKDCAQANPPTPEETAWLKEYYRGDLSRVTLRKGLGCARCNHTGYLGRTGVFEVLEMTDSLATIIHRGDPIAFEEAARRELSGTSLEQQALALVVAGETTIHEAMSVVSRAASR
ncbi:MAG: type II/IV secretion system protein [Rhodocyclaceae bacterium]|jgi:MSHA biogenesis protein MshE|nr:type II/IV secretion system protein [Rhodocyclaceae bacterium]MBK6907078.1 type II/IV secretion system protein [Rhodocyclaceae bacterium]